MALIPTTYQLLKINKYLIHNNISGQMLKRKALKYLPPRLGKVVLVNVEKSNAAYFKYRK